MLAVFNAVLRSKRSCVLVIVYCNFIKNRKWKLQHLKKNPDKTNTQKEVMRWAYSLEALLTNQYGVAVFRDFLRSEFSEENLDFWLAVEKFKRTPSLSKMTTQARRIYDQFLSPCAVNVDSTNHSLSLGVNPASFQRAQDQIFSLMEADSYPRFLKSHLNNYKHVLPSTVSVETETKILFS
uniref:RGS domain-containing protein n=1 Tax=Xiphophorus couchianus TaxID=32473 RepID=A0A3B5LI89_9TELE